jgi:hypothetical protein
MTQTAPYNGISAGNVDLWFGDSWPSGSELYKTHGETTETSLEGKYFWQDYAVYLSRPDLAFPHWVSTHRNNCYINFSGSGRSLDFALYQLTKFCKENLNPDTKYTVFLCTTAQSRKFAIDIAGQHHHRQLIRFHHPNTKAIDQDFAFSIYNSTVCLNNFYLLCYRYNIDLKIIPVWDFFESHSEIDIVPDNAWLSKIPLTKLAFGEDFDLNNCEKPGDDIYNANGIGHALGRKAVAHHLRNHPYIKPMVMHPNIDGHKKLAETIINLLTEH